VRAVWAFGLTVLVTISYGFIGGVLARRAEAIDR